MTISRTARRLIQELMTTPDDLPSIGVGQCLDLIAYESDEPLSDETLIVSAKKIIDAAQYFINQLEGERDAHRAKHSLLGCTRAELLARIK